MQLCVANLPLYIQIMCIQVLLWRYKLQIWVSDAVCQPDLTLQTLYQNVKQLPWELPGFPAARGLVRIAAGTIMKQLSSSLVGFFVYLFDCLFLILP